MLARLITAAFEALWSGANKRQLLVAPAIGARDARVAPRRVELGEWHAPVVLRTRSGPQTGDWRESHLSVLGHPASPEKTSVVCWTSPQRGKKNGTDQTR